MDEFGMLFPNLLDGFITVDPQGQSRRSLSEKSKRYDAIRFVMMLLWLMSSGTACTRHGPVPQGWQLAERAS